MGIIDVADLVRQTLGTDVVFADLPKSDKTVDKLARTSCDQRVLCSSSVENDVTATISAPAFSLIPPSTTVQQRRKRLIYHLSR
jgi:hypothetical protein